MCGIYPDPDLIQQFVLEAKDLLQSIEQDLIALELSPGDDEILNRMFRALHTFKGTSAFLGIEPVARLSHRAEDVLSGLRGRELQFTRRTANVLLAARDQLGQMVDDLDRGATPTNATDNLLAELERCSQAKISNLPASDNLKRAAVSKVVQPEMQGSLTDFAAAANPTAADIELSFAPHTMRVDGRKLDDLIGLVGELVIERNRLLQLVSDLGSESPDEDSPLARTAARISSITQELQAASLRTRMVPIHGVFSKIPRLVRELSASLHKEVDLAICGQETEIDRTLAELLSGPLVHLVRNALDHGIEIPDERERVGKPHQGRVCLEAKQEGDRITICVSDDGAGMEPLRILSKAIEQNIVNADEAAHLAQREIMDLVFIPGFSTAGTAGQVSGLTNEVLIFDHENCFAKGKNFFAPGSSCGTATAFDGTDSMKPPH